MENIEISTLIAIFKVTPSPRCSDLEILSTEDKCVSNPNSFIFLTNLLWFLYSSILVTS